VSTGLTDGPTDVHGLAGAYALNAVDDLERAAFERHLAGCATCALDVAELGEAAARLADDAWSVPPPGLRDRVLAEVRQTRQAAPRPPAAAGGGAGRPAGRAAGRRIGRWRRGTALAVAAGLLVAGAGTAAYLVQEQRVRQERSVADAARAQADRIQDVLTAPDAVLRGTAGPGGGRITVVTSASRDAAVAVLTDLPERGPDRTYQLWVIRDQGATSKGVLAVGATGDRRLITGVRGATAFGVTVEPAGGSATPTTDANLRTVPL
jgi:anti-sigma-K factor RskA